MKWNKEERTLLFESTGRVEFANRGIVGMSPFGQVSEGYDGPFKDDAFSCKERAELADYMISLWTTFKHHE